MARSARIGINGGGTNLDGGSTFNANSFRIENTSSDGVGISRVVFRLAEGDAFLSLLPNIAFDPATDTDGEPAGDAVGKDFSRDSKSVGTFDVSATLSEPFQGGYTMLTLDFVGFDPGETLAFSIDIDPISTKQGDGQAAMQAGKISGVELAGTPVRVEFDDGAARTAELFSDGSPIGAVAVVRAGLAAAPTLTVAGVDGPEAVVDGVRQLVTISDGTPGGRARLLVVEAAAFAVEPDNGYEFGRFEANKAVAVGSRFVRLDETGSWTGRVRLTDGPAATDGINILTAAMVNGDGDPIGLVSDKVTLRVSTGASEAPDWAWLG